jgi:hypothetical protein
VTLGARRAGEWLALGLVVLALAAVASEAFAQRRVRFRTPPSGSEPGRIARDYLRDLQLSRGVRAADLVQWREVGRHRARRSGVTYLYLRQQLGGIELWNGDVTLVVAPDGRLANLRARTVPPARARARPRVATRTAAQAVASAAARIGLAPGAASAAATEPRLVYVEADDGALRLAWSFDLPLADHWWVFNIDARSDEVLTQLDRVRHARYRVYALPLESPADGPRTLEVDPADPNASPFGWHDLDGATGFENDDSQGNNAFTAENSSPGPFGLAVGGPTLDFDFPLDPNAAPSSYQNAAITNLFYWNNVLHDLHLHYGFDEAAGNFQFVHYGSDPNGVAGDDVTALAQDRTGTNNATMATPSDGSGPTMRMHLWANPLLFVASPPAVRGGKDAGTASFGPAVTATGEEGDVAATLPADACSALSNPGELTGRIALIDRGDCNFIDKIDRAELAGAIGVIIANNVDGPPITMGAPAPPNPVIGIPSVMVRRSQGQQIHDALVSDVVHARMFRAQRDSDLDNGVIAHEFGHGVSTRLTGGAGTANCLLSGQAEGMGEGWSDFWALAVTADPADAPEDPRGIGSYLVGEPGIRNGPYSTDLEVNPQTFTDVITTNAPHGVGEIWAQALWETYWLLVEDLGFDSDLYHGSGGNNVALQLVMDGLKGQPCPPDFIDARDAILLADSTGYGSAHECRIWRGFAKRGMGATAVASPVTEDFALPPQCPLCGDADVDGLVEAGDADLIRAELAQPGTLPGPALADCAARSFSGACDIVQVAHLLRGLQGLPPGLESGCAAYP